MLQIYMNNLLKGLLKKGYKEEEILDLILGNLIFDSIRVNFNYDREINYHIQLIKYGNRADGVYIQSEFEKNSFKLFEDITVLYAKEIEERTKL